MGKVLVYGANGVQGGVVLRRLVADGREVRALVQHDRGSLAGVEVVTGDLNDVDSLTRASEGVEQVALVLPLNYDVESAVRQGCNVIDAAKLAGVKSIVFNTSTRLPDVPSKLAAFEIKQSVEAYLRHSGIPFIILRPPFYMDNFAGPWTAPAIVQQGVVAYPVPAHLHASWISVDDAAAFTAAALARPELAGSTFNIGGPDSLDGAGIAAAFSEAFGRPIQYVRVPADDFEQGLAYALGASTAHEIAQMYRLMDTPAQQGMFTADTAALMEKLPVKLTSLTEWVRQQAWEQIVPQA